MNTFPTLLFFVFNLWQVPFDCCSITGMSYFAENDLKFLINSGDSGLIHENPQFVSF